MADKPSSVVAENLVRLRKERGLSQQALATEAGVSQTTIDKLERGEIRRSRYLVDIARALQIKAWDLDPDWKFMSGSNVEQEINNFSDTDDKAIPVFSSINLDTYDANGNKVNDSGLFFLERRAIKTLQKTEIIGISPTSYGIYLNDTAMGPEFEPGDIIVADPTLPVNPGNSCVVYDRLDEVETDVVFIARLELGPKGLRLRNWRNNPESFPMSEKRKLHRIVIRILR